MEVTGSYSARVEISERWLSMGVIKGRRKEIRRRVFRIGKDNCIDAM